MPWLFACLGGTTCDEQVRLAEGRDLCAQVMEGGEALRRGLRGAAELGAHEAALLRYPVPSEACITMEGVEQPLDVYFLGEERRVLSAVCGAESGADAVCQRGTVEVLETAPWSGCAGRVGQVLAEGGSSVSPGEVRGPHCDRPSDAMDAPVEGRLRLVVHRSPLVGEDVVTEQLERAQGWWADHGLWLSVARTVELPLSEDVGGAAGGRPSDALLHGTRVELLKRLDAAGLPPEPSDAAQQVATDEITAELVLGPWRELVHRVTGSGAQPPLGEVHVVFVQHIARPGSLGDALFHELRGLTVSPWLGSSPIPWLELPERYPPVVVVGTEPIDHLGRDAVDVTLAHELGHAMGLPHVSGEGDLMQEGIHRCVPRLRAEQAHTLRGYERL